MTVILNKADHWANNILFETAIVHDGYSLFT